MRVLRILIIGSVFVAGAPALTAAQSRTAVEIREAAGPMEQQAKPLAQGIPLPKRKSADAAEYPWELRRTGARAVLIVQVTVDKSGRVAEIRRAQGPLLQKAIGSPEDPAAERAASAAVLRSSAAALNRWRFDEPASGPFTFPLSLSFVGGQVSFVPAASSDILPKELVAAPWAAASGALPTGTIKVPKRTRYVKPVYPKAALDARVKGEVVLEIVIGKDGSVVDARILKSIPQLDQAAIEATMKARYQPVEVYGNPVSVTQLVTQSFSFTTNTE